MNNYACTPYADKDSQETDGEKFFVRAEDSEEAVELAKQEASHQGYSNVFVEDAAGFSLHDGPVGEVE